MYEMCYWYKAKLKGLVWSLLCSFIVFIPIDIDHVYAIQKGKLMIPTSYTALSGDLHAQLQFKEPPSLTSYTDFHLEIKKLKSNDNNNNNNDNEEKEHVDTIRIYPDPRYNITQITIPCHLFYLGGKYELDIIHKNVNNNNNQSLIDDNDKNDERLKQQLDVRWPYPKLSVTREQIGTYPEEPIIVILTFPEIECEIENMNNPKISEFWLELIYCGQEICTNILNETTKSHVLYAEQIRGFAKIKSIKLRCELFGLAGHYIVQLRPIQPTPSYVSAISYIKADWNEKFVFNVHARSIFPCDPHSGISVLFEYPACILDQADRVRLFAKLRADVASLKPPTSLHYVTEQRVKRGQHALHFDCDYFSEKYVEYCFVYVTQAISGAVADIRMDCVPTLPVSDSDTGGWGPWSEWTPCSTTCAGGTKNRYRFCDSPPPRYGAKFCEGPAVETERCGKNDINTWECLYASGGGGSGGSGGVGINSITRKSNIENADVIAEIGPGCRCGCIVHLGSSKPKRVIASSAQSCPGRSFWLIQADENNIINLIIDFFRLPCSTQYIKIRDGDSLASNLLFENIGGTKFDIEKITSTGSQVLIEFFSDEIVTIDTTCNGGFLAHIQQTAPEKQNITSITSRAITQKPQIGTKFTIVHIAAVIFASIIIIISALLGTQYIFRYRKYHLTQNMGEPDSPIHTPCTSIGSLQNPELQQSSRAVSTNTLLSEVIYLVKIRPKARMKHSILRESIDGENLERETDLNDEIKKLKCGDVDDNDLESIGSTHTLTNEILNEENSQYDKDIISSYSVNDNESINSKQSTSQMHEISSSTTDDNTSSLSKRKIKITDNGNICTSSKQKQHNNAIDIKENYTEELSDKSESSSFKKDNMNCKKIFLSASNMTLTNGCYSPAASIISTATIRTTNQKESKEKLNRERLARPDSEFSLANPEDLELDYYDYNVVNAGAAPGSYLGMDPAYLVWIPPLDDGNIINEIEIIDNTTTKTLSHQQQSEPLYEEILPKYNHIDPGSNTETPDTDHPPEPPPMNFSNSNSNNNSGSSCSSSTSSSNGNNKILSNDIEQTFLKKSQKNSTTTALLQNKDENNMRTNNSNNLLTSVFTTINNKIEKNLDDNEIIQLTELNDKSNHKILDGIAKNFIKMSATDTEKETSVVKSPSDLQDYYELDDIQFADDEDDNNEIYQCSTSNNDMSNMNTTIMMNNKSATIKFNKNYQVKT